MAKKKRKKSTALTIPASLTAGGPSMAEMRRQYEADMLAASVEQAALERAEAERSTRIAKTNGSLDRLTQKVLEKETLPHRVAVDFGGGLIAQVSTELLNYLVRLAGEWSHDGWAARNVDILQGAPHFILGTGLYFGDMLTRKNGKLPSMSREIFSEFAKLFSQLGFANLVRAARVRYHDGKRKASDYDALLAEKDEIERKLKALKSAGGGAP